ncbi:MAG: DUF2085 domain-containing protein [Myxococcales bacterium]|nr:DUF2085 domain-containing protein [Myxococcales bacterium]
MVFLTGVLPWVLVLAGARDPEIATVFRALCHQIPERTLSISGVSMVVCSRCAGIFAGMALGAVFPMPARWHPRRRRLLIIAVVLMVVDVFAQDAGIHGIWHATRLGTGLVLGWAASAWLPRVVVRLPLGGRGTALGAEECQRRQLDARYE